MLRVCELVRQRVQPISPKAIDTQQVHEALSNVGAPDAQPSTLELTRVSPASVAALQDPTRSTERVDERVDLACDPVGHCRCLGGVLSRSGVIGPDRVLVGAHAVAPVELESRDPKATTVTSWRADRSNETPLAAALNSADRQGGRRAFEDAHRGRKPALADAEVGFRWWDYRTPCVSFEGAPSMTSPCCTER
jgi:hypothetical protein